MTVAQRTPPRPLLPVLARIALGLGLVIAGAGLTVQNVRVTPAPGMKAVQTPLNLPLEGAGALNVRLEGNRTDLTVAGLPWPGRAALTGEARHRLRNPLKVSTVREGRTLSVDLRLNVQPVDRGVIQMDSWRVQHKLSAQLSRWVPVSLSTDAGSGQTRLNLHALRVRSLNVRSRFGLIRATLPERQSGPLTFVTVGGAVTLRAPAAWRAPALRVNTEGGDVDLHLGAARVEAVHIGTRSGDVTGELPRADHQSVTTGTGDLDLTLPDGAAGTLDLRAEEGRVTLSLPPGVRTRIRLTDRTRLGLPRHLIRQGNAAATDRGALSDPDLDLFIDARQGSLTLREPPSPEGVPEP